MKTTFLAEDVKLLLNDITGQIEPLPTAQREQLIQSGVHYSDMLPLEQVPSAKYLAEYEFALNAFSQKTAAAIAGVSHLIYEKKGKSVVVVSLARAGTPIGILIKRYLKFKYNITVPHYTISIIRGRGIDRFAMKYLLDRYAPQSIQFVDGWTGKGAISNELSLSEIDPVDKTLAVLADPANITPLRGTNEDFLIASACLNSTVCGLMSRTVYSSSHFHGVAFYEQLAEYDRTYEFINKVEGYFPTAVPPQCAPSPSKSGLHEVMRIADDFNVDDINLIKPGIGEATRVLLRRMPSTLLISNTADHKNLRHLCQLAEEKGVPVTTYPLQLYQACGIIKKLSADV